MLKLSAAPWPFCIALCTDTPAFYITALSIYFFLGFRQWRSRADRVVNLSTTI